MPATSQISVIVVVRNEAHRLRRCLAALSSFAEVWVVDSASTDDTARIAKECGAKICAYEWNGAYPKKRQWCLDHLALAHERVFFVDADEIVTPALVREIAALDWFAAGYFVKGFYTFDGKLLRHGLHNNKLALFDRRMIGFPVVDDLGLEGMGEIEGHYQPVLKPEYAGMKIGQLRQPLIHEACEDMDGWERRHLRYACWEAGMNARGAWPEDPVPRRAALKRFFRVLAFRGALAFLHSYVLRLGFLDGRAGYEFAKSRARYYRMISRVRTH